MKAGLFDRAEEAYRALEGTPLRHRGPAGAARAVRALARLARRRSTSRASSSRAAAARSRRASRTTSASSPLEADARQQRERPRTQLAAGARRRAAGGAAAGARRASAPRARGEHAQALQACRANCWSAQPASFNLVAGDYAAERAAPAGEQAVAREQLRGALRSARRRSTCWRRSRCSTPDPAHAARRDCASHLREQPTLVGRRRQLLALGAAGGVALDAAEAAAAARRRRARRAAAAPLPLRRLRLRGRSTTSGNARAAWPGTAIRRSGWRTCDARRVRHARTPARRARAGGRRRDARPLLVRRGRPHLARGAGAGGARQPRGGAPRRRRQRGAERQDARRAGHAAHGRRRRRAGAPARGAARAAKASRRCSGSDPQLYDHRQAARDRPLAAAAARSTSRTSPTTRCWPAC